MMTTSLVFISAGISARKRTVGSQAVGNRVRWIGLMLRVNSTPPISPIAVPTRPISAPLMRKTRMIVPGVAPMVRRIAMSEDLSRTSRMSPEMMLRVATITMRLRIRNITFRSTSSAPKKVRLVWRQSVSSTGRSAAISRGSRISPTASALSR